MPGNEGHEARSALSLQLIKANFKSAPWPWLFRSLWSLVLGTGGSLLAAYMLSAREKTNVVIPYPVSGQVLISITEVPRTVPKGESDLSRWIRGQVKGVSDPEEYRVVVYSYTNRWYIQPDVKQIFTRIKPTGQWEAFIQGGSYYAALLVKGETPLPLETRTLPTTAPQVITWDVKEGRSNFWWYFWMIFPFAVAAAALIWWIIRRRHAAIPLKEGAR